MTDDDKKRPAGKAPRKSAGGSRGGDRPRSGKPGGGKPAYGAGKSQGATRKPFVKREGADGERGERSARSFAPRTDGDRPPRKPFVKRDRVDGEGGERPARSFAQRTDGDRPPRKPFVKRDRPDGEDGERPARSFAKRADGDRPLRKPFVKRDRPDGEGGERPARSFAKRADGDRPPRKPFVKREGGEAERAGPRRFGGSERAQGADRKPFVRRDREERAGAPDGERPPRPGRFERQAQRGAEGGFDGPRDKERGERAPRRFDGPRGDGATDRPRTQRSPKPEGERPARAPFPRRPAGEPLEPGERIAKRLARVGIASRRDAEDLVAAGRIRVNGRVLDTPAFNVTAEDVIELDGEVLPPIERTRVFLFHKPAGVVTTNRDPDGRKTVFDVLPADLPRVITVGRLDINTEGLLLLTNDGGLARTLELPATGWLRRYRVRVHGKVDEQRLAGLKDGIAVDGVFYGSIEASLDREQGSNAWLTLGLREGKNREVKNILGALGLEVSRLIRISFGPFQLGELPEGHVQELKGKLLRDQLGERLIEESGANFEADIVKPFSNRPVGRTRAPASETAALSKPERAAGRDRIGEGGLIKARKRRENSRDEALGKLSTRPERGGKRSGERPPIEPPGGRKANVWMAPGARPIGKGRAEADAAKAAADRNARKGGKPRGGGNPDGRGPRPGRPPRPKRED